MPKEFVCGFEILPHHHERAQLIYATAGTVRVSTADGVWVMPPQRAVWVPAGVTHGLVMLSPTTMRTLYVREDAAAAMPTVCRVLSMTPLLRELIVRATELPVEYDERGSAGRVMRLILDELASLVRLPYNLPMPASQVLSRICRAFIESPNDRVTIEELGERHGTTTRTLARRFRRETGMSFSEWRRRARLLRALAWIAEGRPILAVALDLGYDSPSAFSAMFKREFGLPPSQYRASAGVPA